MEVDSVWFLGLEVCNYYKTERRLIKAFFIVSYQRTICLLVFFKCKYIIGLPDNMFAPYFQLNKNRCTAIRIFITGFFKTAVGIVEINICQQTNMLFVI